MIEVKIFKWNVVINFKIMGDQAAQFFPNKSLAFKSQPVIRF